MVAKRKICDWILAMRPWAFSASVVPILAVAGWLGRRGLLGDVPNVVLSLVVSHAAWDVAVFVLFPIGGS